MKKMLIAMSGGVDSSVAALKAQEAGYECIGCTMLLAAESNASDAEDAAQICRKLGMEHRVLDCREWFRKTVKDEFVRQYESGSTPNPCIECNRQVKFGRLFTYAAEIGCDGMVTGHYARIEKRDGLYFLKKAKDTAKDQSYFLYMLQQDRLAHIVLPLGEMTKAEVRETAERSGLLTARKRDSQDICFIPDGDYGAFLERYTGKHYAQGLFLSPDGRTLGTHNGAVRYTIGQRKGLGLSLPEPGYVVAKDMLQNTVTVGSQTMLFHTEVTLAQCIFAQPASVSGRRMVEAKLRYSQKTAEAELIWDGDAAVLRFTEPQRAATPGQAAVFYDGAYVLGGGSIVSAEKG